MFKMSYEDTTQDMWKKNPVQNAESFSPRSKSNFIWIRKIVPEHT